MKFLSEKGVTLIEVMVVVVVVTFFSAVLMADFPRVQKRFYLNRAAYKLAQDLRRAQDLSLSGAFVEDEAGQAIPIAGYGIYMTTAAPKEYIIYADSCQPFDFRYTPADEVCFDGDYIVDTIDMSEEGPEVSISDLVDIDGEEVSFNFTPPNPTTTIDNLCSLCTSAGATLSLDSDSGQFRSVRVNTIGLIEVE